MSRDMAYIALCKCGKVVMCCVDEPKHKKDTAKEVASCLRAGFEIKRVTVEYVRNEIEFCRDSKIHMNPEKYAKKEKAEMPLFEESQ